MNDFQLPNNVEYQPEIKEPNLQPRYSRQLYLNSRTASTIIDTTKMSKLSFKLNDTIICPYGFDFYVSLVSAEIPNTIYTVDDTNNIIAFGFANATLGTYLPFSVTLQKGKYSGITGLNSIASQLSGNNLYTLDNTTLTLTVTFNIALNRFSFSYSRNVGGYVYDFALTYKYPLLGTTVTSARSSSSFIASTYPKLYPTYLLLATNLNTNNQAVNVSKQAILDKIPVVVPANSFMFYKNWLLYRTKITNKHIDTINVSLLDDLGNEVNLNGSNWSFTLQIDIKQIKNMPLC